MDNLIFSLNATAPVFFLMVLGYIFKKIGWIDDDFASKMNSFVFKVPLPVLVFKDLATVDFIEVWDTKFVLFCFIVTVLSILISTVISFAWKDKTIQGEFVQVSYRSSAAILGVALIQNIYGDAGMAPLMIIGSVPLYNIMAVVVLTLLKPGQRGLNKDVLKKAIKGIVTNPIIIGIVAGFLWSILKLHMPYVLEKTVSNIGGIATPMGLMAMGAAFDFEKAFGKLKPALTATGIKLVGLCAIFLPIAVQFGFRMEKLIAILVMLGSASTVSCYVMAKNMGHEGTLTSSVVVLTTLFAAFTLTMWIFVLKSLGLI
ncbi:MAG: AEC family transporter [Dorea sp.]